MKKIYKQRNSSMFIPWKCVGNGIVKVFGNRTQAKTKLHRKH